MRKVLLAACLALSLTAWGGEGSESQTAPSLIAPSVRQLVLVQAPTWSSSSGSLQRYERDASSDWRGVGDPIPISLGRNGMAWGRGLQPSSKTGPTKREGDGRSPAGAFTLESAFGAADELPVGSKGFPYLQTRASTYCVEDIHSDHYNRVVDASEVKPTTWQRWSAMRRADGLFRWGVIVQQNAPDVVVGAGSCVFLHIWRGEHHPTAGCTAMAADDIESILRWLEPKAMPVLIQLPEPVYRATREAWGLPDDRVDSGQRK